MKYLVQWTIDIEAGNPVDAAKLARACQIREGTTATVFEVFDGAVLVARIDLTYPEQNEFRPKIEVNIGNSRADY